MKKFSYGWVILLFAFAFGLALIGSPVRAQDHTQTVELVGVIEAANGQTITVNQVTVNVSAAEVKTSLAVGTQVKVEGRLQSDGTILAAEVSQPDQGILPGEIELVGIVDEIGTDFVVVNGLTFDTTASQIQSRLVVGDRVQIHASLTSGGTWAAREAARVVVFNGDSAPAGAASGQEFELRGTLEAVGGQSIVVQGQTINTEQAEIKGTLVVGALVKVHAVLTNDGAWVAREVELASRDDQSCQFEVEADSVNLRSGPGNGYDVVGTAPNGEKLTVMAVHTDGEWVQVAAGDGGDGGAWVSLSAGQLDDCSSLPASAVPLITDDSSSDDGPGHDTNDDHGGDLSHDDGPNPDSNDDHGGDSSHDDGPNHDSSDDHGGDLSHDDGSNHDSNDDHGGDD